MRAAMIREIGEFGLIKSIQELVCEQGQQDGDDDFRLLLGIGDDAAAWRTPEAIELATTDTLVDGVHFRHDLTSWEDLGWKSMAVNLSDIAAMGGRPLYALVTLGLTRDTREDDVRDLYRGMLAACRAYGCRIAGGDIVRSPVDFVTVAMTGAAGDRVLTRRAAKPGDSIAVTGPLGSAAGGLQALLRGGAATRTSADSTCKLPSTGPCPGWTPASTLIGCGIEAAMDVSDGLVDDLAKLCEASGVGAVVEAGRVPAHDQPAGDLSRRAGSRWRSMAARTTSCSSPARRPRSGGGHYNAFSSRSGGTHSRRAPRSCPRRRRKAAPKSHSTAAAGTISPR